MREMERFPGINDHRMHSDKYIEIEIQRKRGKKERKSKNDRIHRFWTEDHADSFKL
jgi:hypothetical protein